MAKISKYLMGIILLYAGAAFAQSGWVVQTSGTTENLMAVDFVNGTHGVAVGVARTILRTTDGGATWTTVNAGTGNRLNCVSFANDTVGVTAGWDGQIMTTQNGGASWAVVQDGWSIDYNAAQQLSPTVGFLMGGNAIFTPFGSRTANGWQSHEDFAFMVDHGGSGNEGDVYGMHFFNDSVGCAAVTIFDGHGAMVRTTNGGTSWITTYWNSYPLNVVTVPQNGADVMYAAGNYGEFLTSTDSGATWTERMPPIDIDMYGLCFVNADTGWAVGSGGRIKRTNDGGIGWEDQSRPVGAATLRSVDFVSATVGYAVGDSGVILKTTSGGEIVNHAPGAFARVQPVDSSSIDIEHPEPITFVWTTSHDMDGDTVTYEVRVDFGGVPFLFMLRDTTLTDSFADAWHSFWIPVAWRVIATDGQDSTEATNGEGHFTIWLPDAVDDGRKPSPNEYSLAAFPNPFNPTTTLSFTLPQAGEATLTIYDIEGRNVFENYFGILSAGEHRVQFDGANLPSGVYISRLKMVKTQISRKLVLMK